MFMLICARFILRVKDVSSGDCELDLAKVYLNNEIWGWSHEHIFLGYCWLI